jgi:hypothetical protein
MPLVVIDTKNALTAVPGEPTRATDALPDALSGVLHAFIAFDWGEEVDLVRAQAIVSAEPRIAPRRCDTPSSIAYRPPPLRFTLQPTSVELPMLGRQEAVAEAIVFDFAAASVALHIPFTLSPSRLSQLAAGLSNPESFQQAATEVLRPLYEQLSPAIERGSWGAVTEEYFVFQFSPDELPADVVLAQSPGWLAGMVRLEVEPLFADEVAEALRRQIRYGRDDLLVADWAAAVLIDRECDETLQTIEFANLQLLEFREIDDRLDDRLAATYGVVHSLARRWLPFWRPYTAQLRTLGDLKVEANAVFERTQNALKLVGDQYRARVYRLLASRFHLDDWERSIQRSLDVIETAYRVLADQAAAWRSELLEVLIVLLILVEIILTLAGY